MRRAQQANPNECRLLPALGSLASPLRRERVVRGFDVAAVRRGTGDPLTSARVAGGVKSIGGMS